MTAENESTMAPRVVPSERSGPVKRSRFFQMQVISAIRLA